MFVGVGKGALDKGLEEKGAGDAAVAGKTGNRKRAAELAEPGAARAGMAKQRTVHKAQRTQARARYPVNLLESEIGGEVSELLSHPSLQLTSGHQAWLLMAIMYLVERERRKALRAPEGRADRVFALARSEAG